MAQTSSIMQSFYKGVNPTDLTIFYREFYVQLEPEQFLLEGAVITIPSRPYVVPMGTILDISHVSFFVMTNITGDVKVILPPDTSVGNFAYQLIRNENAAWNVANSPNDPDGIPEYAGISVANENIMEMLCGIEGHIIYNQGDRLSATVSIIKAPFLTEGVMYVYCRVMGVLFSIDTWKRVISQ